MDSTRPTSTPATSTVAPGLEAGDIVKVGIDLVAFAVYFHLAQINGQVRQASQTYQDEETHDHLQIGSSS